MKITTLLLFLTISLQSSFAQNDSTMSRYMPHKSNIKAKQNKTPKPFAPFLAIGIGPVVDLFSHQAGNVLRIVVVSNKRLQFVNEFSNYSRMNYRDKASNMQEHEMSVTANYGYSNRKRFYSYLIAGVAHREVRADEAHPESNKYNSFVLGGGSQLNFKYISPFIEYRIIKQDYSNAFVGLITPGYLHQVITTGINVHGLQEIEKYNFKKKAKKAKIKYKPIKKTKKISNCYHF